MKLKPCSKCGTPTPPLEYYANRKGCEKCEKERQRMQIQKIKDGTLVRKTYSREQRNIWRRNHLLNKKNGTAARWNKKVAEEREAAAKKEAMLKAMERPKPKQKAFRVPKKERPVGEITNTGWKHPADKKREAFKAYLKQRVEEWEAKQKGVSV